MFLFLKKTKIHRILLDAEVKVKFGFASLRLDYDLPVCTSLRKIPILGVVKDILISFCFI